MKRNRVLMMGIVLAVFLFCASVRAQDEASAGADFAPSVGDFEQFLQDVTQPTDTFAWGGDLRVRQTYFDNVVFFGEDLQPPGTQDLDQRHYFRILGRLWFEVGPFFQDEALEVDNGVKAHVRIAAEPRYYLHRPDTLAVPQWNEVVLDNAYILAQRPGSLPVSMQFGRFDMVYGRGFLILDGTPLDGSRTIHSDAIKATLHLDEVKTDVDLFWINNKGRQQRFPLTKDGDYRDVSEFDMDVYGVYAINKWIEGLEINGYYIYKHEVPQGAFDNTQTSRIVHTVGGLFQGKKGPVDYYAEGGHQWGNEAGTTRRAFGMQTELGYTWADVRMTPRAHVGFGYLSGDDPNTRRYEGWDNVLGRWPQFSEIWAYRAAAEYGRPGLLTNLQRYTAGLRVHPHRLTCVDVIYSFLRANEHDNGTNFPFRGGKDRGHVFVSKVSHEFHKRVSGHIWFEYFIPDGYYDNAADDAFFLRWQLAFRL